MKNLHYQAANKPDLGMEIRKEHKQSRLRANR